MSHTITIPDDIYDQLATEARERGMSIEHLLRLWPTDRRPAGRAVDAEAFVRVAALGEELSARYEQMPNSADLVREDRTR